jgi:hypothetical protein
VKQPPKPTDRLTAVEATILRLEQIDNWTGSLRATAPRAVARLGDLSHRMKPTAIGFPVELTVEEWGAMATEHQRGFSDD